MKKSGDNRPRTPILGYGKPPPGSKSEARAKKYNENCTREIVELCGIVSEKGFTDSEGRRAILFRDVFNTYRWEAC